MKFWRVSTEMRLYFVPLPIMDDKQKTLGLFDLLDEVARDIEDFRKKHPNDYSVKNVAIWWDLERERLLMRHGSSAVVKRLRQMQSIKRAMLLIIAGWIAAAIASATLRVLFP